MELLSTLCPAQHKLVVLDSCHSGEVFQTKARRSAGVNREFRLPLFKSPSFQAIAAARSAQQAADRDPTGDHSPFTRALLDALTGGPDLTAARPFTASELFAYIPRRLTNMEGVKQDPRGGWLDGEGDFYFFPAQLNLAGSQVTVPLPAELTAPERSDLSLRIWGGAVAGGVVAICLVGLSWGLMRRKARSLPTVAASNTAQAFSSPTLCLRIVGTPYIYQAPPGLERITVGRQRRKGNDPEIGNDFVIRVPGEDQQNLRISRRQLELLRAEDQVQVIDRSSAGTKLNDQPLVKDVPTVMKAGDRLTLSDVLSLELLSPGSAPSGPAQQNVQLAATANRQSALVVEASIGDMITAE